MKLTEFLPFGDLGELEDAENLSYDDYVNEFYHENAIHCECSCCHSRVY